MTSARIDFSISASKYSCLHRCRRASHRAAICLRFRLFPHTPALSVVDLKSSTAMHLAVGVAAAAAATRCAGTPSKTTCESPTGRSTGTIPTMRSTVFAASTVCSVENTECPVPPLPARFRSFLGQHFHQDHLSALAATRPARPAQRSPCRCAVPAGVPSLSCDCAGIRSGLRWSECESPARRSCGPQWPPASTISDPVGPVTNAIPFRRCTTSFSVRQFQVGEKSGTLSGITRITMACVPR